MKRILFILLFIQSFAIAQIRPSLMGFSFTPASSGSSYQTETINYAAKQSVNGNTLTTTVESYVDTFMRDAKGLTDPSFTTWRILDTLKVVYPILGSGAINQGINLLDTGNYQVSWSGTITRTSTTFQGNGSTGYGNTGFNPNGKLSSGRGCLLVYVKTIGTAPGGGNPAADAGNSDASFVNTDGLSITTNAGSTFGSITDGTNVATLSGTPTAGIWTINASGSASLKLWQASTIKTIESVTRATTHANYNYYIGALNVANTASYYSNNVVGFVVIADGLSDAGVQLLYKIVNKTITGLGK